MAKLTTRSFILTSQSADFQSILQTPQLPLVLTFQVRIEEERLGELHAAVPEDFQLDPTLPLLDGVTSPTLTRLMYPPQGLVRLTCEHPSVQVTKYIPVVISERVTRWSKAAYLVPNKSGAAVRLNPHSPRKLKSHCVYRVSDGLVSIGH